MHIILLLVFPFFQASSRILISGYFLKFKAFKFNIYDVLNYLYH